MLTDVEPAIDHHVGIVAVLPHAEYPLGGCLLTLIARGRHDSLPPRNGIVVEGHRWLPAASKSANRRRDTGWYWTA